MKSGENRENRSGGHLYAMEKLLKHQEGALRILILSPLLWRRRWQPRWSVMLSSVLLLRMLDMSILLILTLNSLTNFLSFLLSLTIVCFLSRICSSWWSVKEHDQMDSVILAWLLNSSALVWRNIRSIIELESWELSAYWVNIGLMSIDRSRLRLSAISRKVSMYAEWCEYNRS